jgi:hypothetical protein
MASTGSTFTSTGLTGKHCAESARLYAKLEERIMERDQVGASGSSQRGLRSWTLTLRCPPKQGLVCHLMYSTRWVCAGRCAKVRAMTGLADSSPLRSHQSDQVRAALSRSAGNSILYLDDQVTGRLVARSGGMCTNLSR